MERILADEYLKWICGFANAQGGKIYIGTNDDGTVIGVQDSKKLMEDIPNKVRDVLGIIVDVNLLTKDGKDYIEICVNSNSYPVNYKGEYHYRSGSTKQQLKGQALNQFLLQKTGITWDSVPVQGITIVYADRIYIANDCIFPEDWTINDLMGKHRSRPYNPLIANTFFRAGFIEAWGRGIEKNKDSCKEAGNPMPEYTIKREDIMIMFQSLVSSTDQATNQANQGNDNSVATRILKVIQEEPSLSQKKIADVIGEKYSTVKYYMESMKKSGIIKREGSSQKGNWIIL